MQIIDLGVRVFTSKNEQIFLKIRQKMSGVVEVHLAKLFNSFLFWV